MEEEQLDLKSIQHELQTQDNRITADPIWIVYDKQKIDSSKLSKNFEYRDTINHRTIGNTKKDLISELKEEGFDLPRNSDLRYMSDLELIKWVNKTHELGWAKWHYQKIRVFKTVCFTEKAADEYIKRERHHLKEPFTFVDSLYRNDEMIALRNALLAGKLQYVEDSPG
jgi:hypothetical protein